MKIFSTTWKQASETLSSQHPELLQHINAIFKTNTRLEVHTVKYSYGDTILKHGILNNTASDSFAFGLVLNGGLEVFIEREDEPDKIATLAMLKPGNILFLDQDLESSVFPLALQNATSGARSIFLLPRIGNSDRYWRLARRHNIPFDPPHSLLQQWNVFVQLAQSAKSNWHSTLLLFPHAWLEQKGSDALIKYLKRQTIPTPQFSIHKHQLDSIIDKLIEERSEICSGQILKNMFAIANGDLPGFSLAKDQTFAPIDLIQKAFTLDYGLKSAELMHPDYIHSGIECFYSIEMNNSIDFHLTPTTCQPSVALIESAQRVYGRLLECRQPHHNYLSSVEFEFLHLHAKNRDVKDSCQKSSHDGIDHFPHNPFLRKGCIAITPLNPVNH